MSAVLRAYGDNFDVDSFLAGCTLSVCAEKRRGERVFSAGHSNNRVHERSGVHIAASDADFDQFILQTEEATEFLKSNFEQVKRLCEWPGVEEVTLDFGINRRNVMVQCDILPADLIRIAGTLGLQIEMSQYPIGDSSSTE